jgi:G:T-mismatch repair DNA endonuclease (very short patch repair protein)
MADFLTPKQRSALMATVRSRGNQTTEVALAILLRRFEHKVPHWNGT